VFVVSWHRLQPLVIVNRQVLLCSQKLARMQLLNERTDLLSIDTPVRLIVRLVVVLILAMNSLTKLDRHSVLTDRLADNKGLVLGYHCTKNCFESRNLNLHLV
jgi:hypothetical protein